MACGLYSALNGNMCDDRVSTPVAKVYENREVKVTIRQRVLKMTLLGQVVS